MMKKSLKEEIAEILELDSNTNYHYIYLVTLNEAILKSMFLDLAIERWQNQGWSLPQFHHYYEIYF